MINSPLSLENYFFTRIHLDASRNDSHEMPILTSEIESAHHKDDPSRWMLTLTLKQEGDESKTPSYTFEVKIVGLFKVSDDVPKEKACEFVEINGPAVLYGAVREMISNLTARGPHPRIMLPTVTFIDRLATNETELKKRNKKAPVKKKGKSSNKHS